MASPTESAAFPPLLARWTRRLAVAAAAVAVAVLVAWLAVPPIVRAQLESRLTQALGRPTTVEAVSFNPFTLRLSLFKLVVADAAGVGTAPLLAIDAVVANVSLASLWHRAPVFDALVLVRPRLALARDAAGRYNVQDLIDAWLADTGETQRFSLNNIEIDDGAVTFDDGVTGRRHALAALNVGIPFLSSLPYQTEVLVTPRAAGTFNGAHFALHGTTVPFARHREATLDVDIDALALPPYFAYLPAKPRFVLAAGLLTTQIKIVFVEPASGARRLELRGAAQVDGLAILRSDGTSLAAVRRIAVDLDRIDVFGRDVRLNALAVDAPVVDIRRLADGTFEWTRALAVALPTQASAPGPAPAGAAWNVRTSRLTLAHGTVALADETSTFRSTLTDIAIDATDLGTRPGVKGHVKLDLVSADRIASFSGEADLEPSTPAATGHFALAKFSLGLLFPFYRSALAVDVQKGSLDYASAFAVDAKGNLRLSEGAASITDLRLAVSGDKEPMSQLPRLALDGVDVDVTARKVAVAAVQGSGATLRVARSADGVFEMTRLVKAPEPGTAADGGTWTLRVGKLALDRVALDVEDRVPQPPFSLALRDLALTATDVSSAAGTTAKVALKARVGKQGRIAFTGPVSRTPFRMNGEIDIGGFPLIALKPYLEPKVNVVVTDGTLQARGRIAVDAPEGADVHATWKGDIAIADFAALDRPTSSDLARWKLLSVAALDVTLDPFRASTERIALDDFYARLIVYPDATLNLARLVTPGADAEPAPGAKPPPAATAPARGPLPIAIERIELSRGSVNFSDFYIRPNYSANLTDVAGSVSAMSAEQAGQIDLAAHVERTAPVEVHGRLNPFAPQLSLDISARASDIDLPPLSSYSVKYAGYGIEKGQLTFDVRYQVENRRLLAENRLVLDQLTFGPRVESPTATKLPVLLAVALLRNSRGVIDVRLPITGSLDDPEFSVGGIVIQVIVNLITKAATAPFALLSAAFGGGEELSTLAFAPGSATLPAEAQKRVATLGRALADRPALKLDVTGRADPTADAQALQQATLLHAMRTERMKSLAADGAAPASVDVVEIPPDERTRWLTAAYRETAIPDRPRNAIGLLKELPPAEMEALFVANAKVDDDALRELANQRARAVKSALVATGIADDRVYLVAPHIGGDAGATPTRVDLALR